MIYYMGGGGTLLVVVCRYALIQFLQCHVRLIQLMGM